MNPNATCIRGDDGYLYTAPVGSFEPNAWHLYDMIVDTPHSYSWGILSSMITARTWRVLHDLHERLAIRR